MTKHSGLLLACAVLAGLFAVSGCGGSDTAAKRQTMPVEETVYGEQIKQMNRISEETTKLHAERMKNLDRQEGQARGEDSNEEQRK